MNPKLFVFALAAFALALTGGPNNAADPKSDPKATRYETLSYHEVLSKNLKVMDASAVSLMRENHIPIVVFNIRERGNLLKVLKGEGVFTTIA